jgi:hypothetical protein
VLPGINDDMRRTLREHGVQSWFIEKALGTRGDDIWHPTNDELLRAGVVTKIVDDSQFGISGIEGWNNKEALDRQLAEIPIYKLIKENDPDAFKALAQTFFDGVQAGRSTVEIANDIRDSLGTKILMKYLRSGPDAELTAYWKTQLADMQHLEATDPVRCVEFAFPERRQKDFDLMKLLPESLRTQDAAALGALILGTAQRPNNFTSATVDADLDAVVASMLKENPRAQKILVEPANYTDQPKLLCSTIASFYKKILVLPVTRSGPVMRHIMK